jgi:hypothetical protein
MFLLDLEELGCKYAGANLSHDGDQYWTLLNMEVELRLSQGVGVW